MDFNFQGAANIFFGNGKINILPELIQQFGKKVLIITGSSSFKQSNAYNNLLQTMKKKDIDFKIVSVTGSFEKHF